MTVDKENLKRFPDRTDSLCFGCSPANPAGLGMVFYTDGEKVFSWVTVAAKFCGWKNLVHGGIIATILDEIVGRTVIYRVRRPGVTKTLSIEYLKPVPAGEELKAVGRFLSYKDDREASAEAVIYDKAGNLCARGVGTSAMLGAEAVKKVGITNEPVVRWLEELP
jgi:uncharacterized protein (TIGR00369 family)